MERSLMLNVMRLYEMQSDRAAKAALRFLVQFKLPIRLLTRDNNIFEIGGNNPMIVDFAMRTLRAKGIRPKRQVRWVPPDVLHPDFVAKTSRG